MSILSALGFLEGLVYELAMAGLFVPVFLYRVVFKPTDILRSIERSRDREGDARHDENMSPMLFFVLVGVVPMMLVTTGATSAAGAAAGPGALPVGLAVFAKYDFMTKLPVVIAALTAYPLGFAVFYQKYVYRRPLSRKELRATFEMQCGVFGVLYLAAAVLLMVALKYYRGHAEFVKRIATWSGVVALLWHALVEVRIAAHLLGSRRPEGEEAGSRVPVIAKAVGLYAGAVFSGWMFMWLLGWAAILLLLFAGVHLGS
ncbi:MAG: hypothetical protein ACYSU0_20700 [Planctomycetota bacterium]|jgi:hypothetical protein